MSLTRSEQMSRIKGKDTSPERLLRHALWAAGLRYRLHVRMPAGRPDVVFSAAKVAVFVDGCFWHGCPLHYARPRSRREFWESKLVENVARDHRQSEALAKAGWVVVRVWEHDVITDLMGVVERVAAAVRNGESAILQRRVVCVVPLEDGRERRELADLSSPDVIVEVRVGPRVTAKARPKSRVKG